MDWERGGEKRVRNQKGNRPRVKGLWKSPRILEHGYQRGRKEGGRNREIRKEEERKRERRRER